MSEPFYRYFALPRRFFVLFKTTVYLYTKRLFVNGVPPSKLSRPFFWPMLFKSEFSNKIDICKFLFNSKQYIYIQNGYLVSAKEVEKYYEQRNKTNKSKEQK